MTIRTFAECDSEEVTALWTAVFNYTASHNSPATSIRCKLAFQPELFFVAVEHEQLVGTVMAGYDGHRGWIYSLAVDPALRRRGIGAELVRHAERALKELGCLKVNLQLLASNADTVAFYTKIGYVEEPRISMGKLL